MMLKNSFSCDYKPQHACVNMPANLALCINYYTCECAYSVIIKSRMPAGTNRGRELFTLEASICVGTI